MNPEVQMIFDFMLLTPGQRAAFAIRCVMAVHKEESFIQWGNGWLAGSDRSEEAARAAWAAAWATSAAGGADWVAGDAARAADRALMVNPDLNLTAIAEEVLTTHKEEE